MSGILEAQMSEDVLPVNPIIGTEKKCPKCKKVKQIDKFGNRKKNKDGKRYQCKKCESIYKKERYLNNIDRERKKGRDRYFKNRERYNATNKLWRQNNPDKAKAATAAWRNTNPEKVKETHRKACRKYYKKNPGKTMEWVKNNPEKRKASVRRYYEKCRARPMARLNSSISALMRFYLKNNKGGVHWEKLVGFTLKQLKKHLEKQFENGMTWENYGRKGWQVDHKIPVSVFNFVKPEDDDFKRCWSLKNLQPMWAKENIVKSNNLQKPFQPRLIFS